MFNREKQEMKRVPMMPVRDMVIFPQQMTPFIVGREASVRALEEALAGDKKIFLSTQHDASVDDPKPEEIYAVGTLANIVQSVKLPDGNIKVLVEGVERARALSITGEEGFFRANVRLLGARVEPSPSVDQLVQKVTGLYEQFIKLSQSLNYDTMIAAARVDDPARLSDTIAANLQLPVDEKQDLLETVDPLERLNRIADILEIELEKLNVDRNINTRVKRQMERAQKEYYLNEKLKAIQKELGRGEKSEIDELKKKIDTAGMSKEVHEKAIQELKRLELMPPMSAESTVSRNYLDWLLAVPWKKRSKEIRDIKAAEKILNDEHYGLEKVKERILEFLAVRQLVKNPKGSILCFVGPPGVGKTSLGMSIATATGRKFVRMSLRGAARSSRSRTELHVRGPLPRRRVRPLTSLLRGHGERDPHRSSRPAGSHGSAAPARLHGTGEGRDRETVPGAEANVAGGLDGEERAVPRRRDPADHSRLYPRSRGAQPGAGNWQHLPQSCAQGGQRRRDLLGRDPGGKDWRLPRRSKVPRHPRSRKERSRPGDGPGLDRSRRLHPQHRGHSSRRQRQAHFNRQAGRRDAGIGAGRHVLHSLAGGAPRTAPRLLPQPGYSRARTRRSDSERWPVGRHHHRNRSSQRAEPDSGAPRHRHDR